MNKKDKFFFSFVAVWLATHGVGLFTLGHTYAGAPSTAVNLFFVGVLAFAAFWWT